MEAWRRYLERILLNAWTCTRVELVLSGIKGQSNVVDSVAIKDPQEYGDEDKMGELVARFRDTAQQDADGIGGVCRYYLRGIFADGDAPSTRSPVVRIHADDDDSDPQGEESPGTISGHLAQSYRHTEAVMRQSLMSQQAVTQHLSEAVARLAEANTKHENHRLESLEVIESLLSKKHERDIAIQREETREKNMARMLDTVTPLMPIVAGKLLVGKAAPASVKNDPSMLAMAELVKSLTPEDMAKLHNVLGDARFIALAEAMQRLAVDENPSSKEEKEDDDDSASGANPFH